MNTKQIVAVIGASGNRGASISKMITKGNYRVLLQSPESEKVKTIIDDIKNRNPLADVEAITWLTDACWEADIIIIANPYEIEKGLAENIRPVVNQKIVVSVSNPISNSYDRILTAPITSAAEELQQLLPYAKVVNAFNITSTCDFNQPVISGQPIDCFIAGNDANALQTIYDLVKTAGFNPVIAGDLSVTRTLEDMQLLLTQFSMQDNYKQDTERQIYSIAGSGKIEQY